MPDNSDLPPRTGKELHAATRPFAAEYRIKSWWCVGSTFIALGFALILAAISPWWPVRLGASLICGLLLVRAFILYHDFLHGSLLRGSGLAKALFYSYGMVALTPPRTWRHSHNFHHANVVKPIPADDGEFSLLTSDLGSFPLMTTDMWQRASTWQRLRYRIARHPLTMLTAYVTVFFGGMCLTPLLQNPLKNWESLISLIVHGGILTALWVFAGLPVLFFAFLLPLTIAGACGAYLFYAQHDYDGLHIVPAEEWDHFRGSLESSSYLKLGPIMRWFTGNIGYHHVHHLNSLIPFYRLPEAMAAIPELQQPVVTTLRPRDIIACLRLNLWDPRRQQLVSYREATNAKSIPFDRPGVSH